MAMVSGPTDTVATDRYDLSFENPSPKEASAIADQPQAEPGETENRMKAEEALQRALCLSQREQSTIAQFRSKTHAHEKFPLVIELFKISVEKFKAPGLSLQDLAAELKSRSESRILGPFEGPQGRLKTDLCTAYLRLMGLAEEISQAKDLPYTSPWLQLYELAKETGFSLKQPKLLLFKEFDQCKSIADSQQAWLPTIEASKFYCDTLIPNSQKIMHYLEKEREFQSMKFMTFHLIRGISFMHPTTLSSAEAQERLAPLLPYLAKYASPKWLESYLNQDGIFVKKWTPNDDLLVCLYCEKAVITSSTDQKQAQDYLAKAENLVKTRLLAYPFTFSFNRRDIEQKQQEAVKRIAEVKAQLK